MLKWRRDDYVKDETLLDVAVFNYRLAVFNYVHGLEDERVVNAVGYWLQQATELCIKHFWK